MRLSGTIDTKTASECTDYVNSVYDRVPVQRKIFVVSTQFGKKSKILFGKKHVSGSNETQFKTEEKRLSR